MTKRIIVAFALSVAFVFAYQRFILPAMAPPAPREAEPGAPGTAEEAGSTDSQATAPAEAASAPGATAGTPAAAAEEAQPQASALEKPAPAAAAVVEVPEKYRRENVSTEEITAATDVITVVFTPVTGSIKSVTLNKFNKFGDPRPAAEKDQMVLLRDFTEGQYPTEITKAGEEDLQKTLYAAEEPLAQTADGGQRVAFATVLPSGLKITKTYSITPGRYGVELEVRLENLAAAGRDVSYEIFGPAGIPAESYDNQGRNISGILASVSLSDGKMTLKLMPAWDLLAKGNAAAAAGSRVNYAGAVNQYFAAVLRPETDVPVESAWCYAVEDSAEAEALFGDKKPEDAVKGLDAGTAAKVLQPVYFSAGAAFEVKAAALGAAGTEQAAVSHRYILYAGPKDKEALGAFDKPEAMTGFSTLLDYGWLEWFVKGILFLLKAFHWAIPNWGVAIILLTFLIRALMHPLTKKSQVSMAKMQRVQPEIKKLQEKYKNDKQKLGAEQMKLMKEAGANPLGGCLPMLIQLPIFFALYKALMVSIELRQAPFALWITDLAQPDRLFIMPFTLPLAGNEFNLIPLLMLASMVWQQKMQPPAATPEAAQQQKIMGFFMPIFIGVLLYRIASGLNLYILTSTVCGIAEQWIIKRHIAASQETA
jgi:YidC/Oxa1 family membrane protein insertase